MRYHLTLARMAIIKKKKKEIRKKSTNRDFPGGFVDKNLPASAGDMGLLPDPRRSHRQRNN